MPPWKPSVHGWVVLALLLGTLTYAIAEEITLTTYYPSPRGVYSELRTLGNVQIGSIDVDPVSPLPRLYITKDAADTFPALRVDSHGPGVDANAVTIDADGNLGIGVTPSTTLDINGSARLFNQTLGTGVSNLSLQAGAGQGTSALVQWQDNTGGVLGTVNADGTIGIRDACLGLGCPAVNLVGNTRSISDPCGCMAGCDSIASYFQTLGSDNVWRTTGYSSFQQCTSPVPGYCVVAGTSIHMADGTFKPIERISVGESVLGYAVDQERVEPVEVLERLQHAADHHPVLIVMTAGDATVTLTADHRVWTSDGWKRAVDLAVGDVVFISGPGGLQQTAVSSVTPQASTLPLYTIRTRTDNYLANGVLIHTE